MEVVHAGWKAWLLSQSQPVVSQGCFGTYVRPCNAAKPSPQNDVPKHSLCAKSGMCVCVGALDGFSHWNLAVRLRENAVWGRAGAARKLQGNCVCSLLC